MRDNADLIQLNVLANLESLNSVMIEAGTSKEKRDTTISQYKRLVDVVEASGSAPVSPKGDPTRIKR